ncbi:hypothetical protein CspHIS471_0702260 [Cutaneotrichosporon sp. HIS471]|nr:hypothetical protein CspHIS471_0702260 [Cutaneotrichosporon sp. HIS471]
MAAVNKRKGGRKKPLTAWKQFRWNLLDFFCAPATADAHSAISSSPEERILVVCVSDTHDTEPFLPAGDILIHAGDMSSHGTLREIQSQLGWLAAQPHQHKIVIGGNHDLLLDPACTQSNPELLGTLADLEWHDLIYLEHATTSITVCGRQLTIVGSPRTPIPLLSFMKWAFPYRRHSDFWAGSIPKVDILVTHGPPYGYLDGGYGCRSLRREVRRVIPRLHVYGHIHECRGTTLLWRGTEGWARDQLVSGAPKFLRVLMVIAVLCFSRIVAVLGCALGFRGDKNRQPTVLVNAASLGHWDDDQPEDAGGVVMYL